MQRRFGARFLAILGATGCAAELAPLRPPALLSPEEPPITSAGAVARDAARPACPQDMALVERGPLRFCVDRYEASLERVMDDGSRQRWPGNQRVDGHATEMVAISRAGEKPQGYISGEQAQLACHNADKRLCASDEWLAACRGSRDTLYPYGDQRQPNVCNDRFKTLDHHPVVTLFKRFGPADADPRAMWMPRWMNDPRLHELPHTVSVTGAFPDCTNDYGVFDMVGNLHEWVDDPEGTFLGGFFMDTFQNGEGCSYRTRGHEFEYRDYSTGFRCCSEAEGDDTDPS